LLETSLVVATLLGGASALWFFWERIQTSLPRPHRRPATPDLSGVPPRAVLPAKDNGVAEQEHWAGRASTTIFGWRMAAAFPGARGWITLEGEAAAERLSILLREPLTQEVRGTIRKPFWWFRGGRTSPIERFERLGATACLIDSLEVDVARIVAWRSSDERREFIYLQTAPMDPTGLYEPQEPMVEEYAILGDHLITRAEFDDGYTNVEGRPVRVVGADLRRRYLEPYNILIAGQSSPINSVEFDRRSDAMLDELLNGNDDLLEDLRDLVKQIPQKQFGEDPI